MSMADILAMESHRNVNQLNNCEGLELQTSFGRIGSDHPQKRLLGGNEGKWEQVTDSNASIDSRKQNKQLN